LTIQQCDNEYSKPPVYYYKNYISTPDFPVRQ